MRSVRSAGVMAIEWEHFCKKMVSLVGGRDKAFWEHHQTKSQILKMLLDDNAAQAKFPNILKLMIIESVRILLFLGCFLADFGVFLPIFQRVISPMQPASPETADRRR